MARTLYDVLGVGQDADMAEIKAAWRQAVRAHHPDRNPGEEHVAAFKLAKRAFEVLSCEERRAKYDAKLRNVQQPKCAGCREPVLRGQQLCPLCALVTASARYEEHRKPRTEAERLEEEFAWVADPSLYEHRVNRYMARGAPSSDALLEALVTHSTIQGAVRDHGTSMFTFDLGPKERAALRQIVRRLGRATRWMDDLRQWFEGG